MHLVISNQNQTTINGTSTSLLADCLRHLNNVIKGLDIIASSETSSDEKWRILENQFKENSDFILQAAADAWVSLKIMTDALPPDLPFNKLFQERAAKTSGYFKDKFVDLFAFNEPELKAYLEAHAFLL